jgi:hypothetical protein
VGLLKEGTLRILLTCIALACAADLLIISYAERQQQAALDALSNYKLEPQPVVFTAGVSTTASRYSDPAADD